MSSGEVSAENGGGFEIVDREDFSDVTFLLEPCATR